MKVRCPCCAGSGEIEERAPVPLSPMQLRIFDIVRSSKDGIAISALADRVYADCPDGGPFSAHKSVHVQITRANARLAKVNLRIGSETRGHGAPYQLQQLSSGR